MSKELEALERIKEAPTSYREETPKFTHTYFEDMDIIETALKRNVELEQRNLILTNLKTTSMVDKKPLSNLFAGLSQEERYKYIEHIYYTYSEVKEELDCLKLAYQKVISDSKAKDKQVKALEIIKEKKVDTRLLYIAFDIDLEHYNNFDSNYRKHLTQEEFDLLKEVLK